MRFEGAYTALVTPMLENGAVDYDGLAKNLEFQVTEGIAGVVPTGTTGESPTLDWKDHNGVIEHTLDIVHGRCLVIAGTGSNSTEESIGSTRHAAHAGAKAVLMTDCYYNGPSSQELRDEYYSAVAKLFPEVSVIPYVIPGRSGTALAAEDLAILASEYPNISAVKEATGDLARMKLTRDLCGPDFSILSGDDDITYQILTDPTIAAQGVISVMTNIAPRASQEMVTAVRSGDVHKAERLQRSLAPLFGAVTIKVENERTLPDGRKVKVADKYRNPLAIKTMMRGLGMPSGPCRQPLGRMSKSGVEIARHALRTTWTNNPEVLQPIGRFFGIDVEARIADDASWASLAC